MSPARRERAVNRHHRVLPALLQKRAIVHRRTNIAAGLSPSVTFLRLWSWEPSLALSRNSSSLVAAGNKPSVTLTTHRILYRKPSFNVRHPSPTVITYFGLGGGEPSHTVGSSPVGQAHGFTTQWIRIR